VVLGCCLLPLFLGQAVLAKFPDVAVWPYCVFMLLLTVVMIAWRWNAIRRCGLVFPAGRAV
jgi:hypothetical protein